MLVSLQRYHVPGLPADCGGGDVEMPAYQQPVDFFSHGVGCAQCQVILSEEFAKSIPMPSTEKTRLEMNPQPTTENSRLACCMQVRPYMNEMTVVIGNNREQDQGTWGETEPTRVDY